MTQIAVRGRSMLLGAAVCVQGYTQVFLFLFLYGFDPSIVYDNASNPNSLLGFKRLTAITLYD